MTTAEATAQANTEAGKTETLTAEQLHDAAITATEAFEKEQDETKKLELFKTAKESVVKAKETYKAEKEAAKKASDEAAQKNKPPDTYDLKLPENSPLSKARIDEISTYAKGKGLSNEQAQALVEHESQAISKFKENQLAELGTKKTEWLETAKSDKEIGGEAFNQNAELAKRVIDRFGSDDLKKSLNETGLGNHPELVRMIVRIGKSMSEDQLIIPGSQSQKVEKKSAADILYGGT